jgi:LysM repeat protein
MRPRDHRLRLGLLASLLGGALLLGACSRDSGPTVTPTGVKGSPTAARAATPSASASARPSASASASAAPASSQPAAPPSASAAPAAPASASAAPTGGQKYVVEAGDTLGVIAEKFGVTIQQLIDANKLSNPDFLAVGQELIIPGR